jgi:hypothetical protein
MWSYTNPGIYQPSNEDLEEVESDEDSGEEEDDWECNEESDEEEGDLENSDNELDGDEDGFESMKNQTKTTLKRCRTRRSKYGARTVTKTTSFGDGSDHIIFIFSESLTTSYASSSTVILPRHRNLTIIILLIIVFASLTFL